MRSTVSTTLFAASLFALPCLAQESPYTQPDDTWISLSGEVASAGAASFILDYGEGVVTVEMDDWDWYGDAYGLLPGDVNTFFYASGADEEDYASVVTAIYDYDLELTGEVTSISGREFTLDTGARQISVDTIGMPYNPLDELGYQEIDVGDRVTVFGDLDYALFDERELAAETIVTLQADTGGGS